MVDFADIKNLRELDKSNLYSSLIGFGNQVRDAVDIGYIFDPGTIQRDFIKNICVAGMGGSAIGGELLRGFLCTQPIPPIYVHRDYSIPGFVDKDTLVIAASYSGETEETLDAYYHALERGAYIIAISSNGKLTKRAVRDKVPLIRIPNGYAPRAALGYFFLPMLILMSKLGFCHLEKDTLIKLGDFVDANIAKMNIDAALDSNPAVQLAVKIKDKLPLIYSSNRFYLPVAARFQGQLCENAKHLSFYNVFPEVNHNEIVGFEDTSLSTSKLIAIFIRDLDDHARVKLRMDITADFLRRKGVEVIEISSFGKILLERLFYVLQIIDFASYYLALMKGCDPGKIEPIDYLKSELSKHK
ncbi:MAG: bifunctional phosphoglucose/phosphomannose isomerase [candidate division Zixibacteria bacterium]|nr:bifunctional phosphoglucose/phosphomannose isomerase [candidate division Zixibacteria bacterium]